MTVSLIIFLLFLEVELQGWISIYKFSLQFKKKHNFKLIVKNFKNRCMERKSENFSCYTQNQLFRMYPLSFCMHLYTHKHTKLFLFLVLNVTILCILLCCLFFTYYFLDPFLCQYIQIYRHTHFFYLVQIYHHPLNHSFTDRNLSFFQFSH